MIKLLILKDFMRIKITIIFKLVLQIRLKMILINREIVLENKYLLNETKVKKRKFLMI
jgi:hypothetical protein